jgi:hypothetical protein
MLRRFHHAHHLVPAFGAGTFQIHIPIALLSGEVSDRHRVATLHAEDIRQDSRSRFLRDRAPQHRCLRRELSVIHDGDHTQSPRSCPASFKSPILDALDCVTKRHGEAYEKFVERSASNPIALQVKLADLEDNLDVRRLPTISEEDRERVNRYLGAYRFLQSTNLKVL